ncbi:VRR-NUC domain-containing protein [uncultured Anaerococcus sp.]|uniref:VRR-NUC domain-containing protein n=1 Tax=uncultured Anaerococcus sp. TaxID=293428 RepID=UPI0026239DD4|nr:VRR-NUC domain-containing protein [uncultured Anaerococcus sp.]
MLEKTIERYLVKEVKRIGGKAYKFESPGNNGVPDRLVVLPEGRVYFVELKRPKGGKTAALQKLQQQSLKDLGANVMQLHTKELIDGFIKEVADELYTT